MKRALFRQTRSGTVLILALWTLGLLTVFSLHLGLRVRQEMTLLARLQKRSQVRKIAEAGVRKARAVFDASKIGMGLPISVAQKEKWFNNPGEFRDVALGPGSFDVSYRPVASSPRMYGMTDEERRINVNTADRGVLARLIAGVTSLDDKKANVLARAIIDWREYGESEIVGFFSDAYYENLEFPYTPKKKDFETLDELLLVRGMTPEIFRELFDFVTVYGSGKVNINTAPVPVLAALGFSPEVVAKLLTARRGADGVEATADDYVFMPDARRAGGMVYAKELELKSKEMDEIETLFVHKKIDLFSSYFRVTATGKLDRSQERVTIACVFDGNSGRIFYWREKRESGTTDPFSRESGP